VYASDEQAKPRALFIAYFDTQSQSTALDPTVSLPSGVIHAAHIAPHTIDYDNLVKQVRHQTQGIHRFTLCAQIVPIFDVRWLCRSHRSAVV
jgi:hypothetical protein